MKSVYRLAFDASLGSLTTGRRVARSKGVSQPCRGHWRPSGWQRQAQTEGLPFGPLRAGCWLQQALLQPDRQTGQLLRAKKSET